MPPRNTVSKKIVHFNTIARKPFRPPIGQKPVWLPSFTLTLLRTDHLPPNFAQFYTPLSMNKLDIKDYLWNAYGLPVLAVRSYVQQRPVQNFRQTRGGATMRRWFRPRSLKKMTVEMGTREEGMNGKGGGLFVWPDPVENLEPWDKTVYDAADREMYDQEKHGMGSMAHRYEPPGRSTIAEQARLLREGKAEWRPTWKDLGKK